MYIINIKNDYNHSVNFIFPLLINSFMYKTVHMLNSKCTRIMNIFPNEVHLATGWRNKGFVLITREDITQSSIK